MLKICVCNDFHQANVRVYLVSVSSGMKSSPDCHEIPESNTWLPNTILSD
jgi:hypothetical protein